MARLSEDVRTHLVERLATYARHSDIVASVRAIYSVDVTLQDVARHDPTTVVGARDLGEKWKTLFTETRRRYVTETADVAIASAGFRLRELQALYLSARDRGEVQRAAELLEQAAKECGGALCRRATARARRGRCAIRSTGSSWNPTLRVIIGAYNATLARKFSRKARRIARGRLELSDDRKAAEDWETAAGGGIRAVGVGGGVTGRART
jgi:hypothetical protein